MTDPRVQRPASNVHPAVRPEETSHHIFLILQCRYCNYIDFLRNPRTLHSRNSGPLLVYSVKLPQHIAPANHHLPPFPKANALTDKHTKLLILQWTHPTSPERLVPVPNLRLVLLFVTVFPRNRRRPPLALKPTYEQARCDDTVAWDAWCEGVITKRATHGAWGALAKGCANIFVGRYLPRWDSSNQVIYCPMVGRDPFSSFGTECLPLRACRGVVDVTLSK